MIIVTFNGVEHECSKAIKGADYIHLVDDNGILVAAFEGIVNFGAFTISGGTWTDPLDSGECPIAVFQIDGTIIPGKHKCSDVMPARYQVTLHSSADGWTLSGGIYTKLLTIPVIKPADLLTVYLETQIAWVQNHLSVEIGEGSVTLSVDTLPYEDCTIYLYLTRSSATVMIP